MAAIKLTFGSGGSGLTPAGSAGSPSLATALREVADDFASAKAEIVKLVALKTDLTNIRTELLKAGSVYADLTDLRTELLKAQNAYTDFTNIRTAITTLTAKLDADIAVGGATETNYAASCDPAALGTTSGIAPTALGTTSGIAPTALGVTVNPSTFTILTTKA